MTAAPSLAWFKVLKMLVTFTKAFFSLFKRRPTYTMDDSSSLLFEPTGEIPTQYFLSLFTSWASLDPNPDKILSDFEVKCIMHIKRNDSSEFLVIETMNQLGDATKLFILERTAWNHQDAAPSTEQADCPKLQEKMENFANTVVSNPGASLLTSIEEGSQSSTSPSLSKVFTSISDVDNMTLLSAQTADFMSDESPRKPAIDRFLGEDHVYMSWWQGENVRYFKPNRLTLFEIALLANVVHKLHPEYSCLQDHSYHYVDLVYSAIEKHFGVCCSEDASDQDGILVKVDGSRLSNKYGRWRGVMVNRTKEEDVDLVISTYKDAYTEAVHTVIL
jgi:hypothetical protein